MLLFLLIVSFSTITSAQLCTREDCNNRGSCMGMKAAPFCMCDFGFFGTKCESSTQETVTAVRAFLALKEKIARAELAVGSNSLLPTMAGACTAEDCSNQGVCVGTKDLPFCLCNLGRTGMYCEKSINSLLNADPTAPITPCSPSDCNNKGVCLGTKNSYVCACQLGYTGSNCENTPFTLCDPRDCGSNGLCLGTKDKFTCACHLGYSGSCCQVAGVIPAWNTEHKFFIADPQNFADSELTSCVKLNVHKLPDESGNEHVLSVSGTMCEASDCNSAGLCIGTKSKFSCVCNLGYTGDRCETAES
ncbi:EGF-like domain protein, partial [Ostertagia ostertagi]